MNKSDNIEKLAAALVKVQAELQPVVKGKENPFYSNAKKKATFADLVAMVEASRDLLTANGLSVVTTMFPSSDNTVGIETTVLHTSGQWYSGQMVMPLSKKDPQGVAAAITYGTRVAYAGAIGLALTDDDAEGAIDRSKKAEPAEKPVKTLDGRQIQEITKLLPKVGMTRSQLEERLTEQAGKPMTLANVKAESFDALVEHLNKTAKEKVK